MKLIGKIKEAHGLKGDLYALIFSGDISWSRELKQFHLAPLEGPQNPTPYEVEKLKPFKKGLLLKVKGVNDRTQAEKILGLGFYVPDELFISKKGETITLGEILQFGIVNSEGQLQGTITGFSSNGPQDLLVVINSRGEYLVPFVAPWIRDIDFDNKKIVMDLPEGLLGEPEK